MIDLNDEALLTKARAHMIDLNDAGPQQSPDYAGPAWPTSSDHDEIKQALRASAEELVAYVRGEAKNRIMSTPREARWGTKGSLQVGGRDPGMITDHESGQTYDPIGYVMAEMKLGYIDAIAWARDWLGMQQPAKPTRAKAAPKVEPKPDREPEVNDILARCVPIQNTQGLAYFTARGLTLPPRLDDILFSGDLTYHRRATPGIVARIRLADGTLTGGIHRTFLTDDGNAKLEKKMLGPHKVDGRWGAVWLAQLGADGRYGVGEGIETTCSGMQLFSIPGAAALDAGAVRGFQWPQGTRELWVFADAGEAGEAAAQALADRAFVAGLSVVIVRPTHGDDLNDDLRKGAAVGDYHPERREHPVQQAEGTPFQRLHNTALTLRRGEPAELMKLLLGIAMARLNYIEIQDLMMTVRATTGQPRGVLEKQLREIQKTSLPHENRSEPSWFGLLLRNEYDMPHVHEENIALVLSNAPEWAGVIGYDEFAMRIMILQQPPWDDAAPLPRAWQDNDDTRTACWFQRQGLNVAVTTTARAVSQVARAMSYHPVREYLDGLKWDGIPRIETWVTRYLRADDIEINRAFGARWLISAVARIFQPGCQNDHMLILEGTQGAGKSSALKILGDPWFTDRISEIGSKDSLVELAGVWIIELAELDGMSKAEVGRVKAFLTCKTDKYRPPYGRTTIEVPRQCAFAGTVNHSDYLRDETGGRRFWPVACGVIDVNGLRQDRDQLWAEAVTRYRAGAVWWIRADEVSLHDHARAQQSERTQEDAWGGLIGKWLVVESKRENYGSELYPNWQMTETVRMTPIVDVSVAEVLRGAIGLEPGRWSRADQMRVSAWLNANGWERYRKRDGHSLEWRYRDFLMPA